MKSKKYEKILAVVLMVLMVFWTIGTIFAFENKFKAKADSVDTGYNFIGSNIIVNSLVFPNKNYNGDTAGTITNNFMNFRVEFLTGQWSAYNRYGGFNYSYTLSNHTSGSFSYYMYVPTTTDIYNPRFVVKPGSISNNLYYSGWYTFLQSSDITWTSFSPNVPTFTNNGWYLFGNISLNLFTYVLYNCDTDFNGNVYKIELGNEPHLMSQTGDGINATFVGIMNYIKYYDKNENVALFGFYTYLVNSNTVSSTTVSDLQLNETGRYFTLQSRTYYLSNAFNDSSEYDIGYNKGLNDNQPNIYQDGYDKGFELGKIEGRNIGYQQGTADAGNYTFVSLLGAVVDAPITALSGLLNFTILDNNGVGGVNLLSFFYALMTLALIIFVVRLMLGGGK